MNSPRENETVNFSTSHPSPQGRRRSQRHVLKKFAITGLASTLIAGGLNIVTMPHALAYSAPVVLGELPHQKLLSHPLADRANLLVNVADGNLILQTQEFNIAGTGIPLSVTRYYNNLSTVNGQYGPGNTSSIGPDVKLTANSDGSVTYQGPSGLQATYAANGSGGYTTPSSYDDAALSATSGGWKLTFNKSGEIYTFNSSGQFTKDSSANGQSIAYHYNSNGTLATLTDTQGRTVTFTPDSWSPNIGKITDSTGRYTYYWYDGSNRMTTYDDTDGAQWLYAYDSTGNLASIDDPNGDKTTMLYDSSKRVTAITYDARDYVRTNAPTTWKYTYNAGNTVVTDPLNHRTTYSYDTGGKVTSIVDADGNTQSGSWDGNNNLTSITDPSSAVTTMTYDGLNNLTSITNPNLSGGGTGSSTSYSYGDTAHPYSTTTATDAQGNQLAYSYDTAGNLKSTTNTSSGGAGMGAIGATIQGDPNGAGGTTNCGAQNGEICTSIDANGGTTTYGYDAVGNVTSVTKPGPVGVTHISYDALSRPSSMTDGNGNVQTITYDGDDRPAEVKTSSTATQYTYDYDGNPTFIVGSGSGNTKMVAYDAYNRPTSIQIGTDSVDYTYDAAGNVKTEVNPYGAGTTTYGYDPANNVTSIQNSVSGQTETLSYTNNRPTSLTLPGGITEAIGYDQAGRENSLVVKRGTTTILSQSGTYTNAAGKDTELLQKLTDSVSGRVTTYTYDGLNRLTAASQTGTGANSYTYSYDNVGNLLRSTHNGSAGPTYGYNSADELTTGNGSTVESYDQNGNLTSAQNKLALGYDAANHTSSFTPSGGSAISASYPDVDQTIRYKFGSTCELTGLFGLYSDTTSCNGNSTYYLHLPSGTAQAVSELVGTTPYYYITDLLGSVVDVTDGSGNVADTYSYDPYGNPVSSSGSVVNPWRYKSGYLDTSTGLYKFGARYYDTADARWTQLDPSGKNPGYAFAADDPVDNADPTGTSSLFWDLTDWASATVDYARFGSALGALAGCIGRAIAFAEFGLIGIGAGCLFGAIEGAREGQVALGIAGFIYYGVTGKDPFQM